MILNARMLGSLEKRVHTLVQTIPTQLYTRKRRLEGDPPGPSDNICWFWSTTIHSELVFRSPIDREVWVTGEVRKCIIARLVQAGAIFTTRKGFVPVTHPVRGMRGWMIVTNESRRRALEFDGSSWASPKRGDFI